MDGIFFQLSKTISEGDVVWPVIAMSMLLTVACGWVHYEALQAMVRFFKRSTLSARPTILLTMICLVTLHLLEITLFAVGYFVLYLIWGASVGSLQGEFDMSASDLIYFSFVVFTTVGFGDIVPNGPLRILAGVEALVGLMLITWSASFTFLIMQSKWQQERDS